MAVFIAKMRGNVLYYARTEGKTMRKLLIAAFVCLALLRAAALADGLPIYFQKSDTAAPYEQVEFVEGSPFAEDAELLTVDVLGIRQGDCILISCGGETMLVDGGERYRSF